MEVAKTEKLEAEIDRIIEKRAAERKGANAVATMWADSARVHNERRRRELSAEWYDFHERMRETHSRLAEEHEEAAARFLENANGMEKR